ncbi:SRPBCC family protein [Alkalibacillus aidingensis]|uniref:SRPBCC family protein n=1 Tax=Alkalibacillus aidingensis TaxID=2747607 RepID=UPI001660BCA7|nr:SRPBCC family protein [Alkalibacillus aidingensis]
MGFKREVFVNAPVEQVFQKIARYEYAEEKLDHIVKIEILTNSEVQKGTEIKETRDIKGRQVDAIWKVSDYQPNQRFTVKSDQNNLHLIYNYDFEEETGGTRIKFTGNIKTSGMRNLIYKPLIKRIIIKEDGDHLKKAKEYIEKTTQE